MFISSSTDLSAGVSCNRSIDCSIAVVAPICAVESVTVSVFDVENVTILIAAQTVLFTLIAVYRFFFPIFAIGGAFSFAVVLTLEHVAFFGQVLERVFFAIGRIPMLIGNDVIADDIRYLSPGTAGVGIWWTSSPHRTAPQFTPGLKVLLYIRWVGPAVEFGAFALLQTTHHISRERNRARHGKNDGGSQKAQP
jgi:hypothetical protein